MTKITDSILVEPAGTGDPVGIFTVDGIDIQAVVSVNFDGHILGTIPTYSVWSGSIAAAANKIYTHIFNAAGSGVIVKIRKCFIQPAAGVANALAPQTWRVARTNSVGTTGNTGLTIRKHREADAAVPAQVTAAHSATAGAAEVYTYFEIPVDVEEGRVGVYLQANMNILPLDGNEISDYTLAEGEGLLVKNITGGAFNYSVLTVMSIF
jgi:hypothetical protein